MQWGSGHSTTLDPLTPHPHDPSKRELGTVVADDTRMKILTWPRGRKTLTAKCDPIEDVESIAPLPDRMINTMHAKSGVGLAAPQVGVSKRLIVLAADERVPWDSDLVLINPAIVESSGSIRTEEACLSFPGVSGEVERSERVQIEAEDQSGEHIEFSVSGFAAVVLQHEVDHLNGVLFIHRMSDLRRRFCMKTYNPGS